MRMGELWVGRAVGGAGMGRREERGVESTLVSRWVLLIGRSAVVGVGKAKATWAGVTVGCARELGRGRVSLLVCEVDSDADSARAYTSIRATRGGGSTIAGDGDDAGLGDRLRQDPAAALRAVMRHIVR